MKTAQALTLTALLVIFTTFACQDDPAPGPVTNIYPDDDTDDTTDDTGQGDDGQDDADDDDQDDTDDDTADFCADGLGGIEGCGYPFVDPDAGEITLSDAVAECLDGDLYMLCLASCGLSQSCEEIDSCYPECDPTPLCPCDTGQSPMDQFGECINLFCDTAVETCEEAACFWGCVTTPYQDAYECSLIWGCEGVYEETTEFLQCVAYCSGLAVECASSPDCVDHETDCTIIFNDCAEENGCISW